MRRRAFVEQHPILVGLGILLGLAHPARIWSRWPWAWPISLDGLSPHRSGAAVTQEGLRIVSVDLFAESFRTYREMNGGDPRHYPVKIAFSRRVDAYERRQLARSDIHVDDDDPMWGRINNTTLEQVRQRLAQHNLTLSNAERKGPREKREAAEREDEQLRNDVAEINGALADGREKQPS